MLGARRSRRVPRAPLVWLAGVAVLAAVGCPPPADTPATPGKLTGEALRRQGVAVLREVNQARLDHRLPPVAADARLTKIAEVRARESAAAGRLTHRTPDGGYFGARLGTDLDWRDASETLARNRAAAPATEAVRGWGLSPTHRATLLDPAFRRAGVGVSQDAAGTYYIAMIWVR